MVTTATKVTSVTTGTTVTTITTVTMVATVTIVTTVKKVTTVTTQWTGTKIESAIDICALYEKSKDSTEERTEPTSVIKYPFYYASVC